MRFSQTAVLSSICRDSFWEFVKELWDTVVPEKPHFNWHMEYICDVMQEGAERVFRGKPKLEDVVINISPGTSKSTICSILFPVWTWTRMPQARHICGSYSFPLACDLGRKSRDVAVSEKYKTLFPEIILREDQNTKHYFQNTLGGTRYSVGVNGSVTGMHAHFINIDDPLDPNQAASDADRKAANNWLKETLPSRKVDKAVSLTTLIMQRLHQDDPTALFLSRGHCRHVCLPAEDSDYINPPELKDMYVNGLMDPVRLSRQVLQEYMANGEYIYSAQFRQQPVPPGGGQFKVQYVKWGHPPTRFKKLVRGWDKAATQDGGDYTVGVLLGMDYEDRIWVLDVKRFRADSGERERIIKRTAQLDGSGVLVGIEQGSGDGGKDSALNTVKNLFGFHVKTWKVAKAGNKEQRAELFSVSVNEGNVWIPQKLRMAGDWIGWAKEYLEELRYFPHSKYDDQVDASSTACHFLGKRRKRVGGMW